MPRKPRPKPPPPPRTGPALSPLVRAAAVLHLWEERNAMIDANVRLAYKFLGAARHSPAARRLGPDEALTVALEALLKAAERFDPSRGFRFSTYAWNAMWRELNKAAALGGGVIRVPQHAVAKRARPECRELARRAYRCRSLAAHRADGQCVPPIAAPEPGGLTEGDMAELRPALEAALGRLDEREALVVRLRFFGGKTLEEAGKALCVSKERTRQIQRDALAKLRAALGEGWAEG